ncbi:S8 family serine peptidase [Granulosicoccus sp. 3-233]|uniref:S8 family serine peptidase n=1 Tax=Granulosicoccus sp. 3-233 TaxID=3417969 RepID=UPI003D326925
MTRVMVHTFHEREQGIAATALTATTAVTDSYQVGELEPAQIDNLEAQGLIVEVLDQPAQPLPRGTARKPSQLENLNASSASSSELQNPAIERTGGAEEFYLVIPDTLTSEWRDILARHTVTILERVGADSYLARLPVHEVGSVRALSFVSAVREVEPLATGSEGTRESRSRALSAGILTMDMIVRTSVHMDAARDLLDELDLSIIGTGRRKIRFEIPAGSPALSTLRHQTDLVEQLADYTEPQLHNDVAREFMSVSTDAFQASLTGASQTVGIADTGLDDTHPDFHDRLITAIARGRQGDSSDLHGHGTHVAGSMLGSGAASGGRFKGVAPEARFVFQSLMDARGRLKGLPVDLQDLFQEAFDNGVRIHNNSWGAKVDAEYVLDAREADEFVFENPDMLIVTSAGNNASAGGVNEPAGMVDLLSMGSLGAGKNVLTVGASRSSRREGGRASLTYGEFWPRSFPDAPIRDESISGDDSKLAGFSSRGPMQSTRIKPDVIAPGTDIVSARSAAAPDRNYWGNHDNRSYAYLGGTSMASPLAAGMATLVRQYYVERRGHQPTAALLKATLINGTRRLQGESGTLWQEAFPNPHQGFGALNYQTTVPDVEPFDLEFIDLRRSAGEGFTRSGARNRFAIDVDDTRELRVCLTYTDHPGRSCQNGLSLFVERPDGQKLLSNAQRVTQLVSPDSVNNVQIVRIQTPDKGRYSVFVQARNILFPNQDYSLVVTGDFSSPLRAF